MQMKFPFIERTAPSLQICSSANCFREGQEPYMHAHISKPVRGTQKAGAPYKRTPQEENTYLKEKQERLYQLKLNYHAPRKPPFETNVDAGLRTCASPPTQQPSLPPSHTPLCPIFPSRVSLDSPLSLLPSLSMSTSPTGASTSLEPHSPPVMLDPPPSTGPDAWELHIQRLQA